jgi:hypothetical protein
MQSDLDAMRRNGCIIRRGLYTLRRNLHAMKRCAFKAKRYALRISEIKDNSSLLTMHSPDLFCLTRCFCLKLNDCCGFSGASPWPGDAKAAAEGELDSSAFVCARALSNHFTKSGDLDSLGKVDYTKSAIVKLRNQDLADTSTKIRDIGLSVQTQDGAADRGIPTTVATLTDKIAAFKALMNLPRGQIVDRSTLLKEVATDVAALLEQLNALDDLVEQFAATDLGVRFIIAWKHARAIVDTSHGTKGADTPKA